MLEWSTSTADRENEENLIRKRRIGDARKGKAIHLRFFFGGGGQCIRAEDGQNRSERESQSMKKVKQSVAHVHEHMRIASDE